VSPGIDDLKTNPLFFLPLDGGGGGGGVYWSSSMIMMMVVVVVVMMTSWMAVLVSVLYSNPTP